MKKIKKEKHFVKQPYYEGGIAAMKNFLKKNLSYPIVANEQQIEGTVNIRYTINYKGKVVATKIISGIGYGCDEEATRLVKLLTFNVARNRNLKAVFHKNIQIHFRLPKSKQISQPITQPTINYIYSTSAKEMVPMPIEKIDSKESKTYLFAIRY